MTNSHTQARVKTGGLTVDLEKRQVFYQGKMLSVKGLTFEMLATLLAAQNAVVSTEDLARLVWKEKFVSDDTISQRVSLLRRALPEECSSFVESVRSEGYRWTPSIHADTTGDVTFLVTIARVKPWIFAAAALLVIGIIVYWLQPTTQAPAQPVSTVNRPVEHGLDASVYTRVKLARAQQYANASTQYTNSIAISLYQDLYSADPDDPAIAFGLAKASLDGVLKFNADKQLLSPVNQMIERLLLNAPTNPNYLWLRGYYAEVTGNITNAIGYYETAHQQAPESAQIALSLAHLHIVKGQLRNALELSLQSQSDQHRAQFLNVSRVLYLTGNYALARDWFEAALQLSPDDPGVNLAYARLLLVNDEYQAAMALLSQFHQRHEGSVQSYLLAYTLYRHLTELDKAEQALSAAQAIEPNALHVVAWSAWDQAQNGAAAAITSSFPALNDNQSPDLFVANAVFAMARNDTEAALVNLSRAMRLGYFDYAYIDKLPMFTPLHASGIYQEIMLSMQSAQSMQHNAIEEVQIPAL
ncbi:winged helix-turn-helix domain-containing protein [Alteromonas flava]|uniref:winged helix-turn-helix domain-containing protein n=1 Tax=Alteromonas flava TaxID=2048003 RepID=UPI000C290276|nr:winged helix-turn-helix domain-containing protein [Alteromonas flava]